MKKIGVIFGGVSCEHDVSIVTALQLIENIDKTKYEVYPIYIHTDGQWYVDSQLLEANIYQEFETIQNKLAKGFIPPHQPGIIIQKKGIISKEEFVKLDVVIPALHGMNGEDGSVQGLLELANIPYTSSGILGASVGMDKIMMKKVFEANGLAVLPYTYFLRSEWEENAQSVMMQIEATLPYPMFVKPSNLGSSIGIAKAKNQEELKEAIAVAVSFDERVIVEEALEDLTEVNCSALGRANSIKTSTIEQPVSWQEFLTFDAKYLSGTKSTKNSGMESMNRRIPANISKEQEMVVKEMTKKAFKALNSKGVVRVDFLIDNVSGKVYINEINTIPGSFAFYLWEYDGIKYAELIDQLIEIAEMENREKNKNNYTYQSNIVGKISGGTKK